MIIIYISTVSLGYLASGSNNNIATIFAKLMMPKVDNKKYDITFI